MRFELTQAGEVGLQGLERILESVEVKAGWIPQMLSCHSSVRSTFLTAASQHVRSDRSVSVTRRGIKGMQVNNAKHRGVWERTTQALE